MTNNLKKEEIIINAEGRSLGRLSSEIAYYLQGKHCPDYHPSKDKEIFVLVKNLDKAKFTGKKFDQKIILKHTGYIGHVKQIPLKLIWSKDKLKVLQFVVSRMLPKNKLRKKRLLRIRLINDNQN